jgi:GNAT superfamily N-acetyltransferase
MTPVRRATREDEDAAVATVVAAFAHDPAWQFIVGGRHKDVSPHFARTLFRSRVDNGTVWVTDDVTAVGMWEKRDSAEPGHEGADDGWAAYREAVGPELWARLEFWEGALDASRPTPPYWYLGVLATHPDHTGRGLATSVMTPVLEIADREHLDCWLETASIPNLTFYDRRGFCQRLPIDVEGGPQTWWLRRAPAARVIR